MRASDGAPPTAPTRRRALVGVTLPLVAAIVVVAVILTTRGSGRAPARSRPTAAGAATVQRRDLVTSEQETGKISYANPSTVADRLQGTLTWVPAVGRVIAPGQRLFDVDDFPVLLMNGTTPAYRTLGPSDTPGPDIRQLNANLVALGFDPDGIVVDDEWQAATTDGVETLQEDDDLPQTGSLALGTIVFLSGAQRVASLQGRATSVSGVVGEGHAEFVDGTPTSSTPGTSATETSTTSTIPTPPAASSRRDDEGLKRANAAISRLGTRVGRLQRQARRLKRELGASRSGSGSHGRSGGGDSGPASGGDSPVLSTTSTNLVVTVDVSAGAQGVTRVGARVPVVMPSGATVHGHVVAIGQASTSGGSSMVPITIHLDRHENGRDLDQAAVSVTFVERTARHVLSVPVTALVARPGGRYVIQEADPPYRLLGVTLGVFATGYVQVSGSGLRPGLRITDSQG